MPLTSAEKMVALRKRRAAIGIFERTYFGTVKQHEKIVALLAKDKKAAQKKKKAKT